jgi:putative ABC transport system permease protein
MMLQALADVWVRWCRSGRSSYGVILAAALAVAGGIAARRVTMAVVSVPLPFVNTARLVDCYQTARTDGIRYPWSLPIARELQKGAHRARYTGVGRLPVRAEVMPGAPEYFFLEATTTSYPDVAGVEPSAGRWFREAEDGPARGAHVAVVSDAVCKRVGAAPVDCLGRSIKVRETAFTIVGVTPPGYRGLFGTADLWIPASDVMLVIGPQGKLNLGTSVTTHWISIVGRLAPNARIPDAQAELETISRRFGLANGLATESMPESEWPIYEVLTIDSSRTDPKLLRAAKAMEWAVVVLVLAAILNSALILLVRAKSQARDVAIRSALGVSNARVFWTKVLDVALTAVVACGVGNVLAVAAHLGLLQAMTAGADAGAASVGRTALDLLSTGQPVTAATFAALCALGIALGVYDTRLKRDATVLMSYGAIGTIARSARTRYGLAALVALQLACASCACFWAGLLAKSYRTITTETLGFVPDSVVAVRPALGSVEYNQARADQLRNRILQFPEVTDAAVVDCLPLSGACLSATLYRSDDPRKTASVTLNREGPRAMRLLGMSIVRGEPLANTPTAPTPNGEEPVVLSTTAASALFGTADPIGQPVIVQGLTRSAMPARIVGITLDVRYGGVAERPKGALYLRAGDTLGPGWAMLVASRSPTTSANTRSLGDAVTEVMTATTRPAVVSLVSIVIAASEPQRKQTALLGVFAVFALLSAFSGAAAMTRFTIAQRLPELSLRLALGATPRTLMVWITTRFVLPILGGTLAGVGAGLLGARVIAALLYEVSASDTPILVTVAGSVAMGSVAVVAAIARRGVRVDPAQLLRGV